MTTAPIPFLAKQASGSDPLAGASPIATNLVAEDSGAIRRRPGIRAYPGVPGSSIHSAGLVGIYITLDGQIYAVGKAVSERPIYRVTSASGIALGGGAYPATLAGSGRPTFAETEMLLVLAGGSYLQKIELATATSARLRGDPPVATHVVANAQRLLANDAQLDRTKLRYSDIAQGTVTYAGHEIWNDIDGDGGFTSAEARPDPIVAVHENTNEVFIWGTTSLQIFRPDASVVYAPVVTEENGCSAPYSVVKADEQFFWLDQYRRIVMGGGRGQQILSTPIQRTLNEMTEYRDAFGFRVPFASLDALVWTFPTDGRTFAFQRGGAWGQWTSAGRTQWAVTCAAQHPDTGATIVGLSDGRIGELTFESETDLGEPIEAMAQTGFLNRSTERRKHCQCVRLAFRRGTHGLTDEPIGLLRWRDRPGPWEGEIEVFFGDSGETETVQEIRSLGVYRRREWEFSFASTAPFLLISAEEDFEVLE